MYNIYPQGAELIGPDGTIGSEVASSFEVLPGEGWKLFNVTDLVREQARKPQANFGVALCLPAGKATQNTWSEIDFVSREGQMRPLLLVVKPEAGSSGK